MKFRTDFVTNSSSSNFMTVTFNFFDSISEKITAFEEGTGWNGYFSNSEDGDLCFLHQPIKTINELFACLYFYYEGNDAESLEVSIIPMFTAVFLFVTKQIDFDTMMEGIQTYIRDNEDEIDWDSTFGLSCLPDISPEEYDDADQLIEEVLSGFSSGSDEILELYTKLSDRNITLAEIEGLEFTDNCRDYGEFLDHFTEEACNNYRTGNFPHMSKNDPLFEKEVNKWTDIFKEKIFSDVEFDYAPNIEAGIESGKVSDCFDHLGGANTYSWDYVSISESNVDNDKEDEFIDGTKTVSDNKYEEISEHDVFFRLDECFKNSYWAEDSPEKMRFVVNSGCVPKCFTKYPITDLLDKAMKPETNEFLPILLSIGLELRFEDVAHYIYNDTLETLYPLFDRSLKIDPSAYDDLITYASEHGKTEYTAWLLNQKNKDTCS